LPNAIRIRVNNVKAPRNNEIGAKIPPIKKPSNLVKTGYEDLVGFWLLTDVNGTFGRVLYNLMVVAKVCYRFNHHSKLTKQI
jgi:hypothetical protein